MSFSHYRGLWCAGALCERHKIVMSHRAKQWPSWLPIFLFDFKEQRRLVQRPMYYKIRFALLQRLSPLSCALVNRAITTRKDMKFYSRVVKDSVDSQACSLRKKLVDASANERQYKIHRAPRDRNLYRKKWCFSKRKNLFKRSKDVTVEHSCTRVINFNHRAVIRYTSIQSSFVTF